MGIKETVRKFIHGEEPKVTPKQAASLEQEMRALGEWEQGLRPDLKVRLTIDRDFGHLHASYGKFAQACLGEDTDVLTRIGYKIFVWHRRDYAGFRVEEINGQRNLVTVRERLRPRQVHGRFATGALFTFGNPAKDTSPLEALSFNPEEPLATGGDTRVRIMAPSGHWAEAEAVCAEDDAFDKAAGRSLALSRALERLNEAVHA